MEALEHYKIRQLMSADKKYLADLSRVPQYKHFISVYNLLKKDSRQAVMKRMIRNLTYKNRAEKINKETAEILYGEEMKASVSRFQSYFNCHFQHFSNYGLKLNVRQDYTVRPLEIGDRKSTRLNSSHVSISYAVFCLKKKRQRREAYRQQ